MRSLCGPSRPLSPASDCFEEPRGLVAWAQQRLRGPFEADRPSSDSGACGSSTVRISAVLPSYGVRACLEQTVSCRSLACDRRRAPRWTLAVSMPAQPLRKQLFFFSTWPL